MKYKIGDYWLTGLYDFPIIIKGLNKYDDKPLITVMDLKRNNTFPLYKNFLLRKITKDEALAMLV